MELDISVLGRTIPGRGVLVVKDAPCKSQPIPGLLGMNVIKECYRELFEHQGESLFASLSAIQAEACWEPVLRYCYRQEVCPLIPAGQVRVFEKAGEFIPAGSLKLVKVTGPRVPYMSSTNMLLEPGGSDLAPGLLLSPALVSVCNGVTYVPVVNVGATGATVHPKQVLGMLHSVTGIDGQQISFEGENEEVTCVSIYSIRGSPTLA